MTSAGRRVAALPRPDPVESRLARNVRSGCLREGCVWPRDRGSSGRSHLDEPADFFSTMSVARYSLTSGRRPSHMSDLEERENEDDDAGVNAETLNVAGAFESSA